MAKKKSKKVYNKEKHDLQKALRIPVAKKGFSFKDNSKYSRKEKHKKVYEDYLK
jgi:hypothetical protein